MNDQENKNAQLRRQLAKAKRELKELKLLNDLQNRRVQEATQIWQTATGRTDTWPDLGRMLEFLLTDRDALILELGAISKLHSSACEIADEANTACIRLIVENTTLTALLREAADTVQASQAEDGISAARLEYRRDLEKRLRAALSKEDTIGR